MVKLEVDLRQRYISTSRLKEVISFRNTLVYFTPFTIFLLIASAAYIVLCYWDLREYEFLLKSQWITYHGVKSGSRPNWRHGSILDGAIGGVFVGIMGYAGLMYSRSAGSKKLPKNVLSSFIFLFVLVVFNAVVYRLTCAFPPDWTIGFEAYFGLGNEPLNFSLYLAKVWFIGWTVFAGFARSKNGIYLLVLAIGWLIYLFSISLIILWQSSEYALARWPGLTEFANLYFASRDVILWLLLGLTIIKGITIYREKRKTSKLALSNDSKFQ